MRKDPAWRVSASPGIVLLRRLFAVVAVATLGLVVSQRTEGYYPRFDNTFPGDPVFPSFFPPTWNPATWGPGSTLNILLQDDPLWYEKGPFEDYYDLHNFITEYGLRPWAEIETADIQWRLERTTAPLRGPFDSPLTINIHPNEGDLGIYSVSVLEIPTFELQSCIVHVAVNHSQDLEVWKYPLMHEFGHCLGLDHPPRYTVPVSPHPESFELNLWDQLPEWRTDPVMAYGRSFVPGPNDGDRILAGLALDDRIGASWLRPRPGWLEGTGEIYGMVTYEDGSPAPMLALLAVRRDEYGRMREPLTTLVRMNGTFAMAGVPPGDYFLLIVGIDLEGLQFYLHPIGWEFVRIHPTLLLRPVRVDAGARARPVFLSVRRHDP